MQNNWLKDFLDEKAEQYNCPDFIAADPISIPHQFTKQQDREISGFITASIAWGQRTTILKNANQILKWFNYAPHDFICNFQPGDLQPFYKFRHRTMNGEDLVYFLNALQNIYLNYSTLEQVFRAGAGIKNMSIKNALQHFNAVFFALPHKVRTEKHVANPAKKSAAKRLNMFLRWMVRKDNKGVDFGEWASFSPSILMPPLDVHSARIARALGLLKRRQNDWQAVEMLKDRLAKLDADDPVKYDFALYGLGVFEKEKLLVKY